ncbi:HNH endonuclease [Streptomyces scabiei]|uniref:HNH endonuclease n=1 Tax=Streptomyces scabiei TaxID=1930 RepID=UPI0038D45974
MTCSHGGPVPRAKSICLRDGCTSVTVKEGRCASHQIRRGWDRISARNRSRPGDWSTRRAKTLARDRFQCRKCRTRSDLEIDHIRPIAKGGTWELDNLWTLCRACHRTKTYYEDR